MNLEIKPLVWYEQENVLCAQTVGNRHFEVYEDCKVFKIVLVCGNDSFSWQYVGKEFTLTEAKDKCQQYHEKSIKEYLNQFITGGDNRV